MERPVFYCPTCNTGFEVDPRKCPVCRHNIRKDRREQQRATHKRRRNQKVGDQKRKRIYRRDGWACLRCGAKSPLTLDHIVPISKGGTSAEDNLQTLCAPCNNNVKRGKSTDYRATRTEEE